MATHNVDTPSAISAALTSSSGGDEVVIAPGTYAGLITKDGLKKASTVTVRAASKSSPPVFQGQALIFKNCANFRLDWLTFQGTAYDVGADGEQYPTTSEPIRFEGCEDMLLRNARVDFYLNGIKLQKGSGNDRITVEYSTLTRLCVDPLMAYGSSHNVLFDHVAVYDYKIDPARRTGPGNESRHSDLGHIRPNEGDVDTNPMRNFTVRSCYMQDKTGCGKGWFLNNEKNKVGCGFEDLLIEKSYLELARYAAMEITGGRRSTVRGNVVRRVRAGVNEHPKCIFQFPQSSGEFSNNVVPIRRGKTAPFAALSSEEFYVEDGAKKSDFVVSGNQISDTAFPTGWVDLIPGVNVGVGTDPAEPGGGATKPAQMAAEWNNPPTNSVPKDGRIVAEPAPLGTTPERYTGICVIGPNSVAWPIVSALPETAGLDVSGTLGWLRPGVATRKGFRNATPAKNAAGMRRFEMIGGAGGSLDVYSVLAGATMSGITLSYSVAGVWADMSPYTGGFTAPGTPPVEVKPAALTAGQWAISPTPIRVAPGLHTCAVSLVGVTATGVRWYPEGGDGIGRPLVAIGGGLYQLAPLVAGGLEHARAFLGTLPIRLSYATDTVFSDPSTDAKTFTAPARPALPSVLAGWSRGSLMRSAATLCIGGSPLLIVGPDDAPAAPTPEGGSPVYCDGTTVTVSLGEPPAGAVDQLVAYGPSRVLVDREEPVASFAYLPGQLVYACGVTAAGARGTMGFWPVPAPSP